MMKRKAAVAMAMLAVLSRFAVAAPPTAVQATTVPLALPGGVAYDSAGNLYIAATNDHVIRKVDALGTITTVAGTGDQGFAGDGGQATAALLDSPVGVAVDANKNIFIADSHNNRIREVMAATGVIQTIAGTGAAGFGGDNGAATAALLNYPTALAMDAAGNLYIADTNNHRIRKITGTTITTVAGNGEQIFAGDGGAATAAGLDSPNGVGVDTNNNIYIGDTHNQRVRMVTASSGIITTIAGTGAKSYGGDGSAAASGVLARPRGVQVAANGTILIADSDNNRIRSITGGTIQTVAGNGVQGFAGDTAAATAANLDTPRAVTANAQSNAVLADTNNFRVRLVNGSGIIQTIAGLAPANTQSLTLTGSASSVVYGSGSLVATYAFNGNTATGNVTFYDVTGATPAAIGSPVALAANQATLNTGTLTAGTHSVEAVYAGDGNNAATTSGVFVLQVTPLAITATATPVSIAYGVAIPTLTGSLNGVLAQDTGNVTGVFTSTAVALSPPGLYPISVALTGSAAANYTVTLTAAASLTITKALVTVSAPPVSRAYGLANPTLTTSAVGFIAADGITTSASTTATAASPVGPYPITVAISDPNGKLGNYTVTNNGGTLTVTPASVTVSVHPSVSSANASTNVTYTTTVASTTSGVPTGTVTLTSSNGNTFGPFTLNGSGVATGAGKLLGAANGPVTITATYSGDGNYAGNVGTTVINIGNASYTLAAVPPSLTVNRGQSASTVITLTPLSGYMGSATFACTNLPAFASCNFTPSTLVADGSNTPVSTTMTLYTLAPQATKGPVGAAFWIPGAMLALLIGVGRKRLSKRMTQLLMLAMLAAGAFGASGCGSNGSFVTPVGTTQSVVVVSATATAGTGSTDQQQSLQITITINP